MHGVLTEMGITRASNPTPHHLKSFGDTFQWISGTRASFNNDHSISSELINFWPVDPMKCSSRYWNTILKEVKTIHVQLFMKTPRLVGSCLLQTAGALFAGRPPPAVHYDQHNHLNTSSASCTHKEIHAGTLGKRRNMRYIWLEDFNPEVYLECQILFFYAKQSTTTVVQNWDS